MPWIVIRDRYGQPKEVNSCGKDCFDRLEATAQLRRSNGFQLVRVSARIYEATFPSGEVEFLSADDVAPDFPPGRPPFRR